jgi:hypothetical protein
MATILVVYVRAKVIVIVINATVNNISMAVSFVCGGNQNIRRKPPTCRKSMTNFINQDGRHGNLTL